MSEHFDHVMRLPNEPTSKGLCNKMQTAEEFLKWFIDVESKDIDLEEVKKNIFALPKKEQDALRSALNKS